MDGMPTEQEREAAMVRKRDARDRYADGMNL
jgi:hypothetical protein